MRVLLDTNVVLDVLLNRRSHVAAAVEVFSYVEDSRLEGYLCATTVTTVDYLTARELGAGKSRDALRRLLKLFEVAPVNRSVLEQALDSKVRDYEDAVLEQTGLLVGVERIVTRNVKDFRKSVVPACDPAELLACFEARGS